MDANLEQALNPRKFPLFAVRGCAGSGKSTFAEKLKQAIERKSALVSGPYSEVKIFENDEFFIDPVTKEYKFDRDLCPIAAQWTLGRVANTLHLHQKTPCIVANTFTTFPESAGDQYVSNNVQEQIDIPDSVFDEVRRRWEAGEPG